MENSKLEGNEAESLSGSLDPDNNCASTSNKESIEAESLSSELDPKENVASNKELNEAERLTRGLDPDNKGVSNNQGSLVTTSKSDLEIEMVKLEVGEETFTKFMKPFEDLVEQIQGVNTSDEIIVDTEKYNVDNILDSITRSRICGKWFISKADYYKRINHAIHTEWVSNCGQLLAYSTMLEHLLGVVEGVNKEEMFNRYIQDKGKYEILLNKLAEIETVLEQWEIQYRKKSRRKNSCKLEHNTPLCGCCGWQDQWVKNFNNRGVHIKEAAHRTDKHIWYGNMKEMKAILQASPSITNLD
ncbi:unnamed protein product [Meganyctiphanes norvegica]|uniref:Uncharacterized protein n=1 Tax=Meganyctiphanes norvegica TaxID=48144 RepID=A0AAV2R7M9_MEGNR